MTMTAERTHLCLNGSRCADIIDGHARETEAPGTLCPDCLARTVNRVAGLPDQYVRLHAMIGERHAGLDPGIRRPKPGSTCPLNIHVDTLLGNIVETTTLAAEVLADVMGMGNPDHRPAELQVARCAAIVAPNLRRLLPLTHIEVMFWTASGTARGVTTTSGPAIVGDLDRLSTLAHFTLGQTRARIQRDLPCTRCKAKTVGRWAGSDDFDCGTCGSRFPEDDIRRQDKILLALIKKGLIKP
jgi:ribosomal protein L37AE/L43A